jgi:hypothetical protein
MRSERALEQDAEWRLDEEIRAEGKGLILNSSFQNLEALPFC